MQLQWGCNGARCTSVSSSGQNISSRNSRLAFSNCSFCILHSLLDPQTDSDHHAAHRHRYRANLTHRAGDSADAAACARLFTAGGAGLLRREGPPGAALHRALLRQGGLRQGARALPSPGRRWRWCATNPARRSSMSTAKPPHSSPAAPSASPCPMPATMPSPWC